MGAGEKALGSGVGGWQSTALSTARHGGGDLGAGGKALGNCVGRAAGSGGHDDAATPVANCETAAPAAAPAGAGKAAARSSRMQRDLCAGAVGGGRGGRAFVATAAPSVGGETAAPAAAPGGRLADLVKHGRGVSLYPKTVSKSLAGGA